MPPDVMEHGKRFRPSNLSVFVIAWGSASMAGE